MNRRYPYQSAYRTSLGADLRRRSQSRSTSSDSDDSSSLDFIQGVDSRPSSSSRGRRTHSRNYRRTSPSPHSQQRIAGEAVAFRRPSHIPPRATRRMSPSSFVSHGRRPYPSFEDPASLHHCSSLPSTRDFDSAYFEGRNGARNPLEDEVERLRKDMIKSEARSKKEKERRKKAEKRVERLECEVKRQSADMDRMYSALRELEHKVQSLIEPRTRFRNWNHGSLGHSRQDEDPYSWPEEQKGGANHPQRQGAEPDALCPVPDRLSAAIRSQMKPLILGMMQGPLASVDEQGPLPAAGRRPKKPCPPSRPMSRETSSGSGTLVDSPGFRFSVPNHVKPSHVRPDGHGPSTYKFASFSTRNQSSRQRSPVYDDEDVLEDLCHVSCNCCHRIDVTNRGTQTSGVRRSGTHKGQEPGVSQKSVMNRTMKREIEEDDRRPSEESCSSAYFSMDEGVPLGADEVEMSGGCCDEGPVNLPRGRARVQPT